MAVERVLLSEQSPGGNIEALVERHGDGIFFSLWGGEKSSFGMKTVWVRNLVPAPAELDETAIREGRPPLLPAEFCAHPEGAAPPVAGSLRFVWFEEGDAAALFESDQIVGIIPGWSGINGFAGYARDCIEQSPICWPLGTPESNALFDRVIQSTEYWKFWDGNPWPQINSGLRGAFEPILGAASNYYAIHGNKWPPKALARYVHQDATIFMTIGVSVRAQPVVEQFVDEPSDARRIELAIGIEGALAAFADDVPQAMSALAAFPWDQFSWLGDGHTVAGFNFPTNNDTLFTSILLLKDPVDTPRIALPAFRGDAVNLLWVVPITDGERKLAEESGSAALVAKLRGAGVGWVHRSRVGVV